MTTYRRMAQDTVDVLSARDGRAPTRPTMNLPLLGSADWPQAQRDLEEKGAALDLSQETISHLGKSYGSQASEVLQLIAGDASLAKRLVEDLPYIRAEVIYACRYEMAMTPYDVLGRRTSIVLEDRQRGLGVVEEVARLMAQEHHWSTEQQQATAEAYRATLHQQMAAEK